MIETCIWDEIDGEEEIRNGGDKIRRNLQEYVGYKIEFQCKSVSEENIRFSKRIETGQHVAKHSINLHKKSERGFKDTTDQDFEAGRGIKLSNP